MLLELSHLCFDVNTARRLLCVMRCIKRLNLLIAVVALLLQVSRVLGRQEQTKDFIFSWNESCVNDSSRGKC